MHLVYRRALMPDTSIEPPLYSAPDGQLTVGYWTVDIRGHRITNGQTSHKLEPKVMELLVHLAGKPGEVISREELDEQVWGGVTVGYESLTVAVGKLRKALDDDSANPEIVETIPKAGYRLIAEVNFVPPNADPEQGQHPSMLAVETSVAARESHASPQPTRFRFPLSGVQAAAVVGFVAVIVASIIWALMQRGATPGDQAAVNTNAGLSLPDKPSIAVLPFANMSGDVQQDYLADGITENIITTLAQVSGMFVIARNSTFVYKGKPVNVQQIAESLGVRYVLEGSFQRDGQTVRISAQLIDAVSGNHIWAEKYDRQLEGIFELQDSISRSIVTAMQVELTEGEAGRVFRAQTESPEAFEAFMRGREHTRRYNKKDMIKAREFLEKAVELDPGYASAWSVLGHTYFADAAWLGGENPESLVARAEELVRKALELDELNASAYSQLAEIVLHKLQHEEAIAYRKKALALQPGFFEVRAALAGTLNYAGKPKEALVHIREAMHLNPSFPAWFWWVVGDAHRLMGNYDEAIVAFENQRKGMPKSYFGYWNLTITYAQAGKVEKARAAAVHVLKALPDFSVRENQKAVPYKSQLERERISEALLKAGLPE